MSAMRSAVLSLLTALILATCAVPAGAVDQQVVGDYKLRSIAGIGSCLGFDAQGNLYAWTASDALKEIVRKFSPAGVALLDIATQTDRIAGTAVDRSGNVYVLDREAAVVRCFSSSGTFLREWDASPGIARDKTLVTGVEVDREGNVYVGDAAARHQSFRKFTSTGKLITSIGSDGEGPGQFDWPIAADFDANGYMYAVEYHQNRIQKFTTSGAFVTQWTYPTSNGGSGDFEVKGTTDVAVRPDGTVLVWSGGLDDEKNHQLLTYSSSGTLLSTWDPIASGLNWSNPNGWGFSPLSIAVAPNGEFYFDGSSDGKIYAASPVPDPPATERPQRISGSDRYATAVAISKADFASADTVVIATGENFPDALSGAGLCGAYKAPLLLVRRDSLPTSVIGEIARLGAKKAFVIGGANVVSDSVRADLERLGLAVTRLAGASRYDTAIAVATEVASKVGSAPVALIARGDAFPDALALAPLAYAKAAPILLVRSTGLPDVTKAAIGTLGVKNAVVAGSASAVSDAVVAALGVPADRAAGPSRYDTAVEVAKYGVAKGWVSPGFVGIATGANFPDALAGGPACGKNGGVVLMTPSSPLNSVVATWLAGNKPAVSTVQVYGGASVVSAGVRLKIREVLGW